VIYRKPSKTICAQDIVSFTRPSERKKSTFDWLIDPGGDVLNSLSTYIV
jgi:hypothetical protein